MTAVQYIEKRDKFSRIGKWLGLLLGIVTLVAGYAVYFRLVPLGERNGDSFWWMGGPSFIVAVATMWIFWRFREKFIRRHPEMEYLEDWISIVGTAKRYPVDVSDRVQLAPEIARKLKTAASCTNLAFEMRDRMFAQAEEYHVLSAERALLRKMHKELASIAEEGDSEYIEMWELFVNHLRILDPNESPYDDGFEVYRQRLELVR